MRIARLQIFGFRGIQEADIPLNQTSVLIGPNNVGKTTILEALALVLGRDGMLRNLTEHDFYQSSPKPKDRIKVVATIIEFSSEDHTKVIDWFGVKRGVPKWYNPDTNDISASQKAAPYKLACEIGFQARFDNDILEVETCRYFVDDPSIDEVFLDDVVTTLSISLLKEIGFYIIPANRSWDRMMSFGSELFRRVINSGSALPAETIINERDRLRNPASPLEEDKNLKPIIDEVNQEISSLFGKPNDLKLRITAGDSASVLDSVIPHFENEYGIVTPSKRQGSGLISLQSLFLLLHFGKQRISQGKGFCFALEEPELHLPPAIQRRILRRLKTLSTQTVVSTHSSLIAGFSEPNELYVVNNVSGKVTATPLVPKPLDMKTPNALRTLLQVRRVEVVTALMSDIVIFPEGVLDYEWLQLLLRVLELEAKVSSLSSATIGIVPTHDAAVINTCALIRGVHSRTIALVDGDAAGIGYVKTLEANPDQIVLRLPDDWTVEDIIGWILEPIEIEIIRDWNKDFGTSFSSLKYFIACLKDDNTKSPYHYKGDRIVYEHVARIISESQGSIDRVVILFDGILNVALGKATPSFLQQAKSKVFIFKP